MRRWNLLGRLKQLEMTRTVEDEALVLPFPESWEIQVPGPRCSKAPTPPNQEATIGTLEGGDREMKGAQ